MHTLMSFAGSVGALMANSGLENILQTAFGGVAKNGMVVWSSKMANPKLSTAPELKSLPSITDAFELHVYRTHYQAVIWRVSLKPNAHELDPVLYGCICYTMAQHSYWQRYRSVRSNVDDHLSFIYSEPSLSENQECIVTNDANVNICVSPQQRAILHKTVESCLLDSFEETANQSDIEQSAEGDVFPDEVFESDISDVDGLFDLESNSNSWSSSSESESFNSDVDDFALAASLCEWVSQFNISLTAIQMLLSILRIYHPLLPKDPRTLLKTKTSYDVANVGGGFYHHFGIETSVMSEIQTNSQVEILDIQSVCLQLNVDGLPLFKSSNTQFWPILGRIVKPYESKPFPIGIFSGDSKPSSIKDFLQNFVDEMIILRDTGIKIPETDHSIRVEISCVICDTPARAFVKQTKGHSGYSGCDKCSQRGLWKGKMTFPDTNAALRTDLQFNKMTFEEHHIGQSPFTNLGLGMVSQFPIDYMHLVCLGVMKKLLFLWRKGPLLCRQGLRFTTCVSELLVDFKSYMPREFLRKGRSLKEVDRWKATEFRQFLLYTGPVILKDALPLRFYNHFKLLSIAIYCLSSPLFCRAYCDYANQLLIAFVSQFGQLYGDDQYTYNVHGLVHLSNDVSRFGELDQFSSFVFESYLGKLKKLVRKPQYPLQQVIRRLSEKHGLCKTKADIPPEGIVKKNHNHGPRVQEYSVYRQFEQLRLPDIYLSIHRGDNCILSNEKVGLIRNILSPSDDSTERILVIEWIMAYVIVVFTEENETALVPQSWLKDEDTVCYWPPYKTSARLNNAVQKVEPPSDTWSVMSVRALYRSDSYQKARLKLKQSCVNSDLQTDEEDQKRKRRAPNRILDSSDEDCDIPEKQMYNPLPNPPAKLVFSSSSESSSRSTPQPASHRTPVSSGPEVRTPSNSNARQDVPLRMTHATATRMFTLLEQVVQEQREQRQLLQRLLDGGGMAGTEDSSLPEGVTFPLETEEEANNLDDVLANPIAFAAVDVKGGDDQQIGIKVQLAWEREQVQFCQTANSDDNVQPTKHATINDMEVVISKWLAGARDRDGGRNKRMSNASRAENDDINDETLSLSFQ
ncbi:hypothetical protein GQR58_006991 [Nymphon striatum]|nr:hypothetical protein GQR58_006991 [Nymphon striatum]